MDGYAGEFCLATRVEGRPVGHLVRVTIPARNRSQVVLEFGDREQVLTDACVLLCGSVGALRLLELGYTGPLVERPLLTG